MRPDKRAARRQPGGGVGSGAGGAIPQEQRTTTSAKGQAPRGDVPAYRRGHLILVGGRRLCSVHAGALWRTFDATRELLRGGLSFRLDVLALAKDAGAREIVCRERNTGQVYRVGLRAFLDGAWEYKHERYGRQLVLPLDSWDRVAKPGAPRQAVLFS